MRRILVVEDNANLAAGLRMNIAAAGFLVEVASNGEAALGIVRGGGVELIVLDLMLPGVDGIAVLRLVRTQGYQMPVLVLTARGGERDKVEALHAGADDYVTKPFGLEEFMARIHALLRRADQVTSVAPAPGIELGPIEIWPGSREVRLQGATVRLRPKEFELLLALARRPNETLQRAELLHRVWGYRQNVTSRTLDTHIASLRRKLERDPTAPRHIITVPKLGYRLDP